MKTWLVSLFALHVTFFVAPVAALAISGAPVEIPWAFLTGTAAFAMCVVLARKDSVPVPRSSLLRCSRAVQALVLGAFIVLQLVDAYAVLQHGHQILYLEPRPSTAGAFVPLKVLAAGALYLAIVLLVGAERLRDEPLALATITMPLATGSRGLFFFSVLAIVLLRRGWRRLVSLRAVAAGVALAVALAWIGLVREDRDPETELYGAVVLHSLHQFVTTNLAVDECDVPPGLVLTQPLSILLGRLDASRVTYRLTSCVAPEALEGGYGIASSSVGELQLLIGPAAQYLVLLVPLAYAASLAWLLRHRSQLVRSAAVGTAPFVLYSVRAELLYPAVFFLKAFVGLVLVVALDGGLRWLAARAPRPTAAASSESGVASR